MIEIDIPGFGHHRLEHLVLDFNGTLAIDGRLIAGVHPRLLEIARGLSIHVITANTFGNAGEALAGLPLRLVLVAVEAQTEAKRAYVEELGPAATVAIGNGLNDRLLLEAAALGIVVAQAEGAALATILAADLLVPDVRDALDLLVHPLRLRATLRR